MKPVLNDIFIMKKIIILFFMVLAFPPSNFLSAQNGDAELTKLVKQILSARKISNELLPKYTWISRTEILKSREISFISLHHS